MKFGNGCWLLKEGVECFAPAQIYYTKITDKEVTICAPTHRISHRGDTLGGANLTIRITSPMPDVIRVQTDHYMGRRPVTPSFDLNLDTPQTLQVDDSDDKLIITSGSLSLEIGKKTWYMRYCRDGKVITQSTA
ncbi:MAG: alpha-xylosidase, partial [Lachnospiraceae bacterium]|nr:alpha-xylosidase [Lachnospiraceae bacterium]